MEAFVVTKRRRVSPPVEETTSTTSVDALEQDAESTEIKLAILSSLHADRSQDVLMDYLLAYNGSVDGASRALSGCGAREDSPRKRSAVNGYQSSMASFATPQKGETPPAKRTRTLTKKGKTLHLFAPEDVERHTPCSMIHNFLSREQADALLEELLEEAPTLKSETFQLFDRTVESPHTFGFYVDSLEEQNDQRSQFYYNGGAVKDVRRTPPEMLKVSFLVQEAVNAEIQRRIRDFHVDGKKLKFQSPDEWKPNTSFVNCYDGGKESVGYHTDQLTYLGPRAVIGSLSLGVAREFRVRKIVPQGDGQADEQGQIAIHLPHNSLLVMHSSMQEEWKHAIAPAAAIDPHPLAMNKRLNITYRCYQKYLHPKCTPRCKCNVPCVLRCVQRQESTRGRYMWMCHRQYTPGQAGCAFFTWAEFDEDGKPPWADGYKGNVNLVPTITTATLPLIEGENDETL